LNRAISIVSIRRPAIADFPGFLRIEPRVQCAARRKHQDSLAFEL